MESEISQSKSEISTEELNGTECSSNADCVEPAYKVLKVNEEISDGLFFITIYFYRM